MHTEFVDNPLTGPEAHMLMGSKRVRAARMATMQEFRIYFLLENGTNVSVSFPGFRWQFRHGNLFQCSLVEEVIVLG